MTIRDLISDSTFRKKGILEKLICHYLSISRENMRIKIDEDISDDTSKKIILAYHDYVDNNKPLEYVLGQVSFFGKDFFVNEHTLIPRPETEYMINAVVEELRTMQTSKDNNLLRDIGTGCGVLGTSVILQEPTFFHDAVFTDVSSEALAIAQKNYENIVSKYGLSNTKTSFVKSDILQFILDQKDPVVCDNLVLVANLPYIPEKTFDDNVADTVKDWEPKMAFVAGEDGLDYYKIMFDQFNSLIADGPVHEGGKLKIVNSYAMFLEMMTWQVDILRGLYSEYFDFEEVKTFHFNIRIVKLTKKSQH